MICYLGGNFRWRSVIQHIATKLRTHGHTVVSRWLIGHEDISSTVIQAQYAAEDFADILQCDTVVIFQFPCDAPEPSTGRHIEFGYALGHGIPVILVGLPTSVFHYADGVTRYASLDSFYAVYAPG